MTVLSGLGFDFEVGDEMLDVALGRGLHEREGVGQEDGIALLQASEELEAMHAILLVGHALELAADLILVLAQAHDVGRGQDGHVDVDEVLRGRIIAEVVLGCWDHFSNNLDLLW